ncbi:MAG: Na+/H+ antiporter subunit E [Anaerolineaceae bacterium]|nr:Na+/H+ antiporter subunit E [Anaerolineaceae bacterium]
MNWLLLHVMLALIWAALNGELTPVNVAGGFVVGFLVLLLARGALGCQRYVSRVPRVLRFGLYFLAMLVQANLRVTLEVLTLNYKARPAIVAVPLDIRDEVAITTLANLITLTPGTLSLDVSSDRRVLYVHAMFVTDVEAFRLEIKDGLEQRVQDVFT